MTDQPESMSPHGLRLLHWSLALTMLLLLFTGFCLHAGAPPDWSLFKIYPAWLPSLRAHMWHFILAAFFSASLVPATVFYLAAWRRRGDWGGYRILHLMLLVGGIVMIVTGVVLTRSVTPRGLYLLIRGVHLVTAIVAGVAFLMHTVFGFTLYLKWLVPSFAPWRQPRWSQLLWAIIGLPIAGLVIFSGPMSAGTLTAEVVDTVPDNLADLPWQEANPLRIPLSNGANFDRGVTRVTLKALHDGSDLFVYATWEDLTENRSYNPWVKRTNGWERLAGVPQDEYVFYEDKFSLVFPIEDSAGFDTFGCAYSCHLGGGMPYGYKATPKKTDVWHWKSTRLQPVGQTDDKWWWRRDPDNKDYGRFGDPKTGGGYTKNFNEDKTRPGYLAAESGAERLGGLLRDKTVPYSEERARALPVGAKVPGIVFSPLEGDRGDIASIAKHEYGGWHVYFRRKLDTGSEHDRTFEVGALIPFGCAAFDNAAKRHAYNHRIYTLKLSN